MAGENNLFKIDSVVVDGIALPIEDGSGTISGAARWENTIVPSGSGDDFASRKRVPTLFKTKLQFGATIDPAALAAMQNVQITARDTQANRRALMPNCSFASMGDVGAGGSVDVTWNVLSAIQWL